MKVELDRSDIIKVLLALDAVCETEGTSEQYKAIRDSIRDQVKKFDESMEKLKQLDPRK